MVHELCPDGVEYKTIGTLTSVIQPQSKIKADKYAETGNYPIIDQGQEYIGGYTNEGIPFAEGEYVIFGDHTCAVKYVDFPFVQGADGIKVLIASSVVKTKYLYYAMININLSPGYSRHWATMKNISIPVPPIEIQNEIVRILDKFDSICNDLTSGIPAEIEARQKQYEYYRDKLLTFKPKAV